MNAPALEMTDNAAKKVRQLRDSEGNQELMLRVYVTGGNLFTITGYSGLDPEVNTFSNKSTAANSGKFPTLGLDWGSYPRARTFTVGLNLEF